MARRWVRPAVGVIALVFLATGGCATARPPLKLQVAKWDFDLSVGGRHKVEAILSNRGKTDFKFEVGSGLRYSLMCRRPIDPPQPSNWTMVVGSGVVGGVFGGVADGRPDPDDPFYCRSAPPAVLVLPAGGSLPLSTWVETYARCTEGEAELSLPFSAPDFGRKCPGIWQGEVGDLKHRVALRHQGAEERIVPTASPKALACSLSTTGPNLTVALDNPTAKAWRARTVPQLELVARKEPVRNFWAPLSLDEPPGPLAIDRTALLDIPAHGKLLRTVSLKDLKWAEESRIDWPAAGLDTVPEGSYQLRLRLEVLGGKSSEFYCGAASYEHRRVR